MRISRVGPIHACAIVKQACDIKESTSKHGRTSKGEIRNIDIRNTSPTLEEGGIKRLDNSQRIARFVNPKHNVIKNLVE